MRKVYEYRNKAQAELVIVSPSGKTRYKYKFTGGVMDPKNKIHAKHTTDNPIMQRVLENSPYFNKVIFLVAEFGNPIAQAPVVERKVAKQPAPVKAETAPAEAPKKGKGANKANAAKPAETKPVEPEADQTEPKAKEEDQVAAIYEDVTNLGSAISILMSEGGVDGADVTTIEGVLKAAKEKNISFPNLK